MLRELFREEQVLWIDLLNPADEERFQLRPELLAESIGALNERPSWVVIDEVQRALKLLDVVHQLIEAPENHDKRTKFALTGSSARKLKRGSNNLLAGRAYTYNLFPFTHIELEESFDLMQVLAWGSLPAAINAESEQEKKAFLDSYSSTYLREEIAQEQLVRDLIPFRKFLAVAAQSSGAIVNYNKIARDVGVDWATVRNYFEILEDTHVGFRLPAYVRSIRKQQLKSPKFYLFDSGVQRSISRTLSLSPDTGQAIGPLFEAFVICEMLRLNSYFDRDYQFYYLATQGGAEIDLIVERPGQPTLFIEIKSSENVHEQHLKHLRALSSSLADVEALCLCREPRPRKMGDILILPWREGFKHVGLSLDKY